jgi:hypothetical protein
MDGPRVPGAPALMLQRISLCYSGGVSVEHPMRKRYLLSLALAAAGGVNTFGQAVQEQPPLYRGANTIVDGVFVTPIAGVPFTAMVMIKSQRTLEDGATETRMTQSSIARDSRGRIRNERHALMPETFHGAPPLIAVHIFDPATRISNIYNPATLISRQQVVPAPAQRIVVSNPNNEDLGITTLNDLQAKGTRVTRTIPGQFIGIGKPVEVTDEIWYSPDLHMNLLERHSDVRGGTQTVAILSIKREEPSPELFEVPAGYKIVDLTPPANAPVARRETAP